MSQIEKSIDSFVAEGKALPKEDNFRPNVRVEVISARVTEIGDAGSSKNIKFSVEGEKYDHSGYISSNELVYKLLVDAHERNVPVIARLERKRKKGVDPHADIMDLTKDMNTAKDNAVKTTVGIYDINNNNWILTSEAESSPSEDPESVGTGIRSVNYNPNSFFESKPASSPVPHVNKNRELSSKADNLVTLFFFVKERANKLEIDLTDEQLKVFTRILVTSCDFVQTKMFKMDAPVYSDYSYTRTRYLLFNYEEHYKEFTADDFQNPDTFKAWAKGFIKNGGQLWEWATELANE